MAQNLIKINYEGENCAGLYLVDNNFGGKELTKELAPKGRASFKLVLRQTVQIVGKGKVTSKETFVKHGMTFLKAIQSVIAEREVMKQRIVDKVTGVTSKREDEAKVEFITVDELWKQYYYFRTTSATQGKRQKKWVVKYSVNGNESGGTAYIMNSAYNGLVKPYLGKKPVLQIKKKDVVDLINMLVNKKKYSKRYVKGVVDILKPMLEWFYDREEIDKRNPAGNVSIQFDNKRNVEVAFKDIQKLYKTIFTYKNEKYRSVFMWLATGRRIGEVLSLHTDDIQGEYFTVTANKNKAGVNMIYKMSEIMKEYVPRTGYVHTAVRDSTNQLSKESVDRHWKNIKRDSGLYELHIHDLRHIIATELKNSGVPLELRSWVLGHKISGMTGRYETDTKEQADEKAKAIGFFLDKVFERIDKNVMWNSIL